ncbi:A/G-specific adenine glycosylase [Roseomonas sp. 573]|uniref:Adenine DNA glycosylase n=1 Tax=Roseomonas haemaphysalidis TaxID=2768162 RepID=A0ABS3KP75_9PROT|nr:A/G-specific adenine glycosylase [Roseomonas haemaphysalidis]MBO1079276.1 A/G-specific adenine glycosylase [Roseomonas haemaphysalidis]
MLPAASLLLEWYDRHRRTLPWREATRDPYRIWLSEVMLQQTTVAAVGPRWRRFLVRFPDVETLAAAPWDAVAEEWAGLGYYARARNLHACAQAVVARGGFPDTEDELRALPGIGAYTAAAVAAIAFGRPTVPLDGNVERVTARLGAIEAPLPGARPALAALARRWMEQDAARARPSDFVQALFDLGATICTPRSPACALCPWRSDCEGFRTGLAPSLPRKAAKKARPLKRGVHFLLLDGTGRLLLRRRPPTGLLGGMLELPGTPWRETPWTDAEIPPFAPLPGLDWRALDGEAKHGFTHFELHMALRVATAPPGANLRDGEWMTLAAARAALPGTMQKLLDLAESEGAMG